MYLTHIKWELTKARYKAQAEGINIQDTGPSPALHATFSTSRSITMSAARSPREGVEDSAVTSNPPTAAGHQLTKTYD